MGGTVGGRRVAVNPANAMERGCVADQPQPVTPARNRWQSHVLLSWSPAAAKRKR